MSKAHQRGIENESSDCDGSLIAGCSAAIPDAGQLGPAPEGYRQIVKDHVRVTFFDPYSIRDAEISSPFPGGTTINHKFESGMGWVVCLRANAKNRMGAYTGSSVTAFVIREGRVVHTLDETGHLFCGEARYEPFNDLV